MEVEDLVRGRVEDDLSARSPNLSSSGIDRLVEKKFALFVERDCLRRRRLILREGCSWSVLPVHGGCVRFWRGSKDGSRLVG